MKKLGACSVLKIAITTIIAMTALILLAGYAEVDNILRPPRNIPQGKTLRKYNIPYQDVELITEDGIHLAAWYTPPRKGAVILVAHGFGDQRPEWVYEMLAREPKFLWLEDGVPHQQIFLANPQRYKRRLIEFFDEWLLGN